MHNHENVPKAGSKVHELEKLPEEETSSADHQPAVADDALIHDLENPHNACLADRATMQAARAEIIFLRGKLAAARRAALEEAARCCEGDFDSEMKSYGDHFAEIIRAAAGDIPAQGPDGFDRLIEAARAEATKAMRRFPQPNYVISKIAEEAGEVVKAAIHCAENRETAENVAAEMTQLLAMLIRLWLEGDEVHGLPPVSLSRHMG